MRRFKAIQKTFSERLAEEAEKFRQAAEELPIGSRARDLMLRRVRQGEAASNVNGWLISSDLNAPK